MFVTKSAGIEQNGTLMSWIKRDTDFMSVLSIYLFVCQLLFYPDHLFASSVTTDHPTSGLLQKPPDFGHQSNVSKDQEQPSTSSRDIVEVEQPKNLSGDSLRPDQPTTSLREKGLELSCNRPKLPFSISPKFDLPVPQAK